MVFTDYCQFNQDLSNLRKSFITKTEVMSHAPKAQMPVSFIFDDDDPLPDIFHQNDKTIPSERQITLSVFSKNKNLCCVLLNRIDENGQTPEVLLYHEVECVRRASDSVTQTVQITYELFARLIFKSGFFPILSRSIGSCFITIDLDNKSIKDLLHESSGYSKVTLTINVEVGPSGNEEVVASISNSSKHPAERQTIVYDPSKPLEEKVENIPQEPAASAIVEPEEKLGLTVAVDPGSPNGNSLSIAIVDQLTGKYFESLTINECEEFGAFFQQMLSRRIAAKAIDEAKAFLKENLDCPVLSAILQNSTLLEMLIKTPDIQIESIKTTTHHLLSVLKAAKANKEKL